MTASFGGVGLRLGGLVAAVTGFLPSEEQKGGSGGGLAIPVGEWASAFAGVGIGKGGIPSSQPSPRMVEGEEGAGEMGYTEEWRGTLSSLSERRSAATSNSYWLCKPIQNSAELPKKRENNNAVSAVTALWPWTMA